jgi:hypothetical protein
MDFIVGILVVIIIILILINFTSVSVTDNEGKTSNSLFLTNKIINQNQMNQNQMNQNINQCNIPSPVLSKEPTVLNNKLNLNAQTYDYNKYFYL